MMPEQVQEPATSVAFFVPGTPVPQGSKTAYTVGKRAIVTDSNAKRLKPWRATVTEYAVCDVAFDVPVAVELTFQLARPQKPRFELPGVRPDIDKLSRAVLDGLTDAGVIRDDARVVDLHASKAYADQAGVWVKIRRAS